jgi:hypothetical protein
MVNWGMGNGQLSMAEGMIHWGVVKQRRLMIADGVL